MVHLMPMTFAVHEGCFFLEGGDQGFHHSDVIGSFRLRHQLTPEKTWNSSKFGMEMKTINDFELMPWRTLSMDIFRGSLAMATFAYLETMQFSYENYSQNKKLIIKAYKTKNII